MATYNGAAYLSQQLESLAVQTRLPDELVVCDDGSKDETVSILQSFAEQAPFPVRIVLNIVNMGSGRNFMHAAGLCEGDWIAFSDQDDVWLPDKLERVEATAEVDPRLSMIVHLSEVADEELRPTGYIKPRWLPKCQFVEPLEYCPPKWWWMGSGHCLVFRSFLVRDLPSEELPELPSERLRDVFALGGIRLLSRERPHDNWICLLAGIMGRIYFLREVLLLHRRHDGNESIFYPFEPEHRSELDAASERLGRLRRAWMSEHYYCSLYGEYADRFAAAIDHMVRKDPQNRYAPDLARAADRQRALARWMRLRVAVYEGTAQSRLTSFIKLLTSGAYVDKGGNFGIRMLWKDLFFCVIPVDRSLRRRES